MAADSRVREITIIRFYAQTCLLLRQFSLMNSREFHPLSALLLRAAGVPRARGSVPRAPLVGLPTAPCGSYPAIYSCPPGPGPPAGRDAYGGMGIQALLWRRVKETNCYLVLVKAVRAASWCCGSLLMSSFSVQTWFRAMCCCLLPCFGGEFVSISSTKWPHFFKILELPVRRKKGLNPACNCFW